MEKIDLTDCTFIIPLKIDGYDREQNFKFVINYLCSKFDTNIIITETSDTNKLILKEKYNDILVNNNITLIEKPNEQTFHRTKYLNDMLIMSKTKITINYDIDVFLPVASYLKARDLINQGYDLVFPYGNGQFQFMVPQFYRDQIINTNIFKLETSKLIQHTSICGHLQFFNTESYKKGFGENESFISYGPEDKERFHRFQLLGFKVTHIDGSFVFHLEHFRGKDSGQHENFESNEKLWETLKSLSKDDIIEYYNKQNYCQKFIT